MIKPSDFAITKVLSKHEEQYKKVTGYQLTPDYMWDKIYEILVTNNLYSKDKSFIDLGAGFGCLIAYLKETKTFKSVDGIEYDKTKVLLGKKTFTDLNLIQGDVAEYKPTHDIIYTFNICTNKSEVFYNILDKMKSGQVFIESADMGKRINNMMESVGFSFIYEYYGTVVGIK